MIPINETETKTFVHGTLADSSIFRRTGYDFLPLDEGGQRWGAQLFQKRA